MKLMVVGLVLMLSLVWLAGCGNDDAKETGNNGVVAEQPGDTQSGTDGTSDGNQDGDTATDNGSDDNGGNDASSSGDGDKDQTGSEPGSGTNTGGSDANPGTTTSSTVTIQINCSLLVGKDLSGTGLETLVPADGIILPTTKMTITPGETVYDLTLRVTKAKKIHMASEGSQAMGNLYIAAIANIYEKAYNSKSGWVYLINGTKPGIGSGVQTLKAGDKLVWAYSLNLGNDL